MQHVPHHRTPTPPTALLTALVLAAATTTGEAVDITNNSSWTFNASVPGSGLIPRTVSPGETNSINLLGDPTGEIMVRLVTPGSITDTSNVQEIQIFTHRGGSVVIDEQPLYTEFTGVDVGNPYATGYATTGFVIDVEPNNADMPFRTVGFAASSDCQFCVNSCSPGPDLDPDEMVEVPLLTNIHMVWQVDDSTGLRGMIMAGDLTQFTEAEELNAYKASIQGREHDVYDGLGNHDVFRDRVRVRNFVHDRRRSSMQLAKTSPMPHYSWNWHDIHFIQANIFPANEPSPSHPDLNPVNALSFIEFDLAVHVGDSGRPVVLIHHYGFDPLSLGWWSSTQRQAYWDVIKDYNVVLIVTGHAHYDIGDNIAHRVNWFDGDGPDAGRDPIPNINVGASRYGTWTEIEFNARNQFQLSVRDRFGTTYDSEVLQHKTPIWVDASNPDIGYGWSDSPFQIIEFAMIAKYQTDTFGGGFNLNNVPIRIAPGNYGPPITFSDQITLDPDGEGSIVIGRP